ncbi:MAG: KpsF/GutQ family sugar-phosphate isomerase [Planctomycetes bacterium]|nr:KpsF/GutQ family sugar-phosphate isomerase [Planctomycetota bacterium]
MTNRLAKAREVLALESQTIAQLGERLGEDFSRAIDFVLGGEGRVVVTGMGKAGIIGRKISATLASTGTLSFDLHPAEAIHGDLGRIRADDILLALSNSGETEEVLRLLSPMKKLGVKIIAVTASRSCTLARHADAVLEIGSVLEACPLGLAPTASTAAMLALGDALAMVLLQERGFGREEYAFFHPGGSLGRQLLKVHEVMRTGDELPLIAVESTIGRALEVMTATKGRPGIAIAIEADRTLAGVFTDGDARRSWELGQSMDEPLARVLTRSPKAIAGDALASEAMHQLKKYKIDQIVVVSPRGEPIGLLDVQDLLELNF